MVKGQQLCTFAHVHMNESDFLTNREGPQMLQIVSIDWQPLFMNTLCNDCPSSENYHIPSSSTTESVESVWMEVAYLVM